MEQFKVSGMTCNHCKMAVTKAIQNLDPQAEVTVDVIQGKVEVQSVVVRERIAEAIVEAGYELKS